MGARASVVAVLVVVASLTGGGRALAGLAALDDGFDDPKLARDPGFRRPTRTGVSPVAPPSSRAPASEAALVPRARPSPPAVPTPPVPSAPPALVAPSAPLGPPSSAVKETATTRVTPPARVIPGPGLGPGRILASADHAPVPSADVAARDVPARPPVAVQSPSPGVPWSHAPLMKLSYRRFPFARIGASTAATPTMPTTLGPSTPESFDSVVLDFYPMSSYLRVGLSSQFGWESSKFDRSGDYFVAESASVGFQLPGRFTPFLEGLAGAGYMRRRQTDGTLPTAFWQVGIDAGVEIYFAGRAYGSIAVGYLHPGNLFVMQQSLMSVKTDSWSLKIGVGI